MEKEQHLRYFQYKIFLKKDLKKDHSMNVQREQKDLKKGNNLKDRLLQLHLLKCKECR